MNSIPRDVAEQVQLLGSDRMTAFKAAFVLGGMGKKAVPALRKALKHKRASVREYAALSLSFIGEKARAATQDLIELLKEKNPGARTNASLALAKIGEKALTKLMVAVSEGRVSYEQADPAMQILRSAVASRGLARGVKKTPPRPLERRVQTRLST